MPRPLRPHPHLFAPMPSPLCPLLYILAPMPSPLCPRPYAPSPLCPSPYTFAPIPSPPCPQPYALAPMPLLRCPYDRTMSLSLSLIAHLYLPTYLIVQSMSVCLFLSSLTHHSSFSFSSRMPLSHNAYLSSLSLNISHTVCVCLRVS